jgi:hypothetical protein
MLRSKPKVNYCGLTIILSNASRFDKADLLTGQAGWFFSERCLRPDFNRYQCDVRIKEDTSELLPNTKAVLLLGESAAQDWLKNKENTLNEIRGSPYVINGIPHIASYFPQDCVDFKDYESTHNPLASNFTGDEDYEKDDNDDDSPLDEKRRHGRTKRRNFGFWLIKDCLKIKHILKYGLPEVKEPEYIIYPNSEIVIKLLTSTKNQTIYFDCETDTDFNITCFAFSFDSKKIYVVPCLLPDYSHAYSSLPRIYMALSVAIRDNITVAHNGANFDFFVLAYKYKIAINKVYDTLVSMHRCFPEQEKSLGHGTSLWTWERFHKDLGDVPYNNLTNANKVWLYCGKDVFTMALIKEAIDVYASKTPGVKESIEQANASIRPYLITSLQGIRFNKEMRDNIIRTNDRLMMQYIRWLDILVGKDTLKLIRGKGKSAMPSSNPQCVKYFHDLLGYPIISKGKVRKNGTTGPSLGKKNLFKLRLKVENPVIDICIAYRELAKETGALSFTPWKE